MSQEVTYSERALHAGGVTMTFNEHSSGSQGYVPGEIRIPSYYTPIFDVPDWPGFGVCIGPLTLGGQNEVSTQDYTSYHDEVKVIVPVVYGLGTDGEIRFYGGDIIVYTRPIGSSDWTSMDVYTGSLIVKLFLSSTVGGFPTGYGIPLFPF